MTEKNIYFDYRFSQELEEKAVKDLEGLDNSNRSFLKELLTTGIDKIFKYRPAHWGISRNLITKAIEEYTDDTPVQVKSLIDFPAIKQIIEDVFPESEGMIGFDERKRILFRLFEDNIDYDSARSAIEEAMKK